MKLSLQSRFPHPLATRERLHLKDLNLGKRIVLNDSLLLRIIPRI